ncbi:MAG TPA: helical backbone metal receptor [Candidatus Nanopelagicales bacterium]|jgi:ABC-type Fe3+-hydroxamate transport system substrate-binding protein|nr:helical backbone metal receptor [Candidatus Nanopelagicales bacterium]
MADPLSITDDLGREVTLTRPVRKVVSLVPSLTEALAATAPELLVGATDWCTHPADLDVVRVRGTKNPDLAKIVALEPDLVVANQEENRELDVRRLQQAGVSVWVTAPTTVPAALDSLGRLVTTAVGVRAEPAWLEQARRAWAGPVPAAAAGVAVPIWRDPWMVVGPGTFAGDLLRRIGFRNVYDGAAERYPHTTLAQLRSHRPDLVVLPDEPYRFTAADGPEALTGLDCRLVSGRLLTWYGPSLVTARETLAAALG